MSFDPQKEIERLTRELAEAKKLLGEGKAQRKLDAAVRQAMQDSLHRKNHLIVRSAYPSLCVQIRGGGDQLNGCSGFAWAASAMISGWAPIPPGMAFTPRRNRRTRYASPSLWTAFRP